MQVCVSKRTNDGGCKKNGEEEAGEYGCDDCSLVEDTHNEYGSEWIEE